MANIQAILREPGVEGALWTLGASDDPQNPKSPKPIQHNSHDQEAVILKDERAVVDRVHYSPGGKYRSIVKLRIRYEGPKARLLTRSAKSTPTAKEQHQRVYE
ncbi:hypothetical protein SMACR_08429 [Sordaria macrospora]|uniref:WGS project CABT00000000 data, contig 2.51 n=2 Tax=Sordaria macrospora TaxID=5147 RepID=F7W9C9_SORMK|nr:uncharacterized protein SMAC_08429 [Sordaria macrospora k-hell]KAA8624194.1 hypothetical protein SMACR_08429 [Sordaria macrospora]WPJ64224.1 hypothetical protein SMAC4_08429 [Sordaria macrospora]CCC13920.1 unnamed protein product [Sordaria macrospora k-hell]